MFSPNLMGYIKTKIARDVHGRQTLSEEKPCPFGPVDLNRGAKKTSVRADSSGSRGSADQISSESAVILVPSYIEVQIGDVFGFSGEEYEITAIHVRYAVDGFLDHRELQMETHLG